jgi:hypothetical protein
MVADVLVFMFCRVWYLWSGQHVLFHDRFRVGFWWVCRMRRCGC